MMERQQPEYTQPSEELIQAQRTITLLLALNRAATAERDRYKVVLGNHLVGSSRRFSVYFLTALADLPIIGKKFAAISQKCCDILYKEGS